MGSVTIVKMRVGDGQRPLAISESEFVASVIQGDEPRLIVSGSADKVIASTFGILVDRLHRTLWEARCREIIVDVRKLEFMSATAFNAFVRWAVSTAELAPELRYKIRFLASRDHLWQRRSLGSLVSFAPDLITIVTT